MDIIRFNNVSDPTLLTNAEIVNGLKSKMWIERYLEAGEFTLVADASVDMKSMLPIGCFISHVDTKEVMIVENHEITDKPGENSEITITGRGLETYFENRIVGANRTYPTPAHVDYINVAADYIWNQVVAVINNTFVFVYDPDNGIPHVTAFSAMSPTATGESVARQVKVGDLYTRMLELLQLENLGVKILRPGFQEDYDGGVIAPSFTDTRVLIHKGVDRSHQVVFSYDSDDFESAEYLWTNKKIKNGCIVNGKYWDVAVIPSNASYHRRMMMIDATDLVPLDSSGNPIDFSGMSDPIPGDYPTIVAAMERRGREALAAQKDIALTKVEISKSSNKAGYRKDFNVGDIISVLGAYNETTPMRITEYVEIEDEITQLGYPTLALI